MLTSKEDAIKKQMEKVQQELEKELRREKELSKKIEKVEKEYNEFLAKYKELEKENKKYKHGYNEISNSRTWKYFEPARRIGKLIKGIGQGSKLNESTAKPTTNNLNDDKDKKNNTPNSKEKEKLEAKKTATKAVDKKSVSKEEQKLVEELRRRLQNLGFTERAYNELYDIVKSQSSSNSLKRKAARVLALWHANERTKEGAKKCLEMLEIALKHEKDRVKLRQSAVMAAECHDALGNFEEGKRLLSQALETEVHIDLILASANLESSMDEKLKVINKALDLYKIKNVYIETPIKKSFYDSLRVNTNDLSYISSANNPKVTVIVPVFNAEDVIETALDSLLAQTWTNLEIIVADDCSTDSTVSIVEGYIKRDPRVQLIITETNGGPYVARNMAMSKATGEFITVNDADDWSHPQKIEKQVNHLLKNPNVVGNTSQQARATEDLQFYRRGNMGTLVFQNMSSFMFRRKLVLETIGYLDCVRFGADNEYIRRLKRAFGEEAIVNINSGPLSFQRQDSGSLTGNKAFGFHGFLMGARAEYFEGQNYAHDNSESIYYDFPSKKRPFAIPEPMWPTRDKNTIEGRRHFDVIIVSDFRQTGKQNKSDLDDIVFYKEKGLKVGLIQMNSYEDNPKKKVQISIREMLDSDRVQMIVYGEKVLCDFLLIKQAHILQDKQEFIPDVKCNDVHVIIDQDTVLKRHSNLNSCQKNLRYYFDTTGIWHPENQTVKELLINNYKKEIDNLSLAKNWSGVKNTLLQKI